MPPMQRDHIKPVVIWTAIMTGLVLSLVKVFGDGFLESRDVTIKFPYLEKELIELKVAQSRCAEIQQEVLLEVTGHHEDISHLDERLDKCELTQEECRKKVGI